VSIQHNVSMWGTEIAELADHLGIDAAALHALASVEVGAIPVVGGMPVIRFEVHVCLRRSSSDLSMAIQQRDAPSVWHRDAHWYRGGSGWERVHTGRQCTEWGALAAAAEIDPVAAIESASWGVGQLMGFHWAALGYDSPQTMAARAMRGIPAQLRMWGRFVERDHGGELLIAARYQDWEAVARLYNGTGQVAEYSGALQAAFNEASEALKGG
jgi:hypothetical protein